MGWLELQSAPPRGDFCPSFEIPNAPARERIDLDTIAVVAGTTSGPELLPRVSGPEACANGGFYLDVSQSPSTIQFCP